MKTVNGVPQFEETVMQEFYRKPYPIEDTTAKFINKKLQEYFKNRVCLNCTSFYVVGAEDKYGKCLRTLQYELNNFSCAAFEEET
jgi:hypothetical protein